MDEFEAWLEEMATKPLPGGVAAAALSAAMGAALVTKVTAAGRRLARGGLADLALASRADLLQLAADDEAAYRRVLDTRHLPAADEAHRGARQGAIDVPLRVAETCRRLLAELPTPEEVPSPALAVDFEIGRRLLQAGIQAGVLAAGQNLEAWGEPDIAGSQDPEMVKGRQRLASLRGGELT